uniref:Uncharacterized protein n=1 Tax=Arundo donax TaxID=35708 RepID=A0A0A8YB28_ARUDO
MVAVIIHAPTCTSGKEILSRFIPFSGILLCNREYHNVFLALEYHNVFLALELVTV